MLGYSLMINTNHALISGDELNKKQKEIISEGLLTAKTSTERVNHICFDVQKRGSDDRLPRMMYPLFFIPPYNDGKKLKTILGQTPKTMILSANMYELEILRLLCVLTEKRSPDLQDMISKTLERLKTTCFGYLDDGVGECFDTSLVVLRFLATAAPNEKEWIQSRIDNYNRHADDKKRPWFSLWYYWLCLSELPFDLAKPELDRYKNRIFERTNKSCVMNSEKDKTIHPVLLCILRNCLCRYDEYAYIKDRRPYTNEKNGRLYFNTERSTL